MTMERLAKTERIGLILFAAIAIIAAAAIAFWRHLPVKEPEITDSIKSEISRFVKEIEQRQPDTLASRPRKKVGKQPATPIRDINPLEHRVPQTPEH